MFAGELKDKDELDHESWSAYCNSGYIQASCESCAAAGHEAAASTAVTLAADESLGTVLVLATGFAIAITVTRGLHSKMSRPTALLL